MNAQKLLFSRVIVLTVSHINIAVYAGSVKLFMFVLFIIVKSFIPYISTE